MNYYSPEVCRQLQQLGCVASGGMWWGVKKYHSKYELLGEQDSVPWRPKGIKHPANAYSAADFLASPSAKENLIRVFGENGVRYGKFEWKHNARQLLDIILSGGDGESFIKEALEKRE